MRSTKSTTQALERLAKAMDIEVTREGTLFVAHHHCSADPDIGPHTGKSAIVLAHLAFVARLSDDFEDLRQATQYDPGTRRGDFRPDVPTSGLSGWEEEALQRLAITEEPT